MTRLLFVTGVSCAGKTTLGRALNEHPDVSAWTDLDEHADERPKTGWTDWLRWRAATALHNTTDLSVEYDGRLYVVSGIVWPFRVVESPAWRPAVKAGVDVGWLLLDPPWKVLRARLDERCADQPKSERRELRAYNRGLRRTLREQTAVMRNGRRVDDFDLPDLVALALQPW